MDPVLIPWSGKTRENGLKSSTTARAGSRVISPRTNYSSSEGEGGCDGCEKPEGAMNLEGERQISEAFPTTRKELCIRLAPMGAGKTCFQLFIVIEHSIVAPQ